jgi:hypothetical protein
VIAPVRDFQSDGNRSAPWHPGKLWSLWEMLRDYAENYIQLGEQIYELRMILWMRDDAALHGERDRAELKEEEKVTFRKLLKEVIKKCEALDLPQAQELVSYSYDDLPKSQREFDLLIRAVIGEIKQNLFMFIPQPSEIL